MTLDKQVEAAREAFDAVAPPASLEARLHRSLREPSVASYASPMWGALAGAAAALVLGVALGWWLKTPSVIETERVVMAPPDPSAPVEPEPDSAIAGTEPTCAVATDDRGGMVVPARCRIELERFGVAIDAWERTALRTTEVGVAMESGLAAFAVQPVPVGQPPFEVDVGAARIRVIGTRFVVANDAEGGRLDLIEGSVELVRPDAVQSVAAGQRVSWSTGEAEVEAEAETAPAPKPTPRVELSETLRSVARLRRQAEYDEALEQLESLRRAGLDAATRAIVSYERGTLLEVAGRTEAACKHWREHLRRHGGRGPDDVAERRTRLGCAD